MTWTIDKLKQGKVHIGIRSVLAAATVLSALLGAGCIEDYLREEAVGRATKQEVIRRLGPPVQEDRFTDGGSILIYQDQGAGLLQKSCREYRLSFDSKKLLREWIMIHCQQNERPQ